MRRSWAAVVAVLSLAVTGATAASEDASKKPSLEEMFTLPSHVQLLPINAPIDYPSPNSTPITIYLKVSNPEQVGAVCKNAPRIADAIMQELFAKPIPVKDRRVVLDGLPERLLKPVNKSLGKRMVSQIEILFGAQSMGSGAISKLPFGSAGGCTGVKDMLDRVEKAKKEQK